MCYFAFDFDANGVIEAVQLVRQISWVGSYIPGNIRATTIHIHESASSVTVLLFTVLYFLIYKALLTVVTSQLLWRSQCASLEIRKMF